ncbi:uncharacterized protein LOC115631180 [Scaptodrosophila lebanonensis]|uniref:Uncharacterized protein LOC115631180 n=1 Tax=Drosophila lebanonensis TaxID=7225 RepID=A0A6J2U5W7_DROLE|nr:uncharacterized protein LOC115631180 [Scaptodrosophila lebanonensis]
MSSFRRITKLVVNIKERETHIIYDDGLGRKICGNSLKYMFQSGEPPVQHNMSSTSVFSKAAHFLRHHFGPKSTTAIEMTPGAIRRLYHVWPLPETSSSESEDEGMQQQNWIEEFDIGPKTSVVGEDEWASCFGDFTVDSGSSSEYFSFIAQTSSEPQESFLTSSRRTSEQPKQNEAVKYTVRVKKLNTVQPQWATYLEWPTAQLKVFNRAWHLQSCTTRTHFTQLKPKCKCHRIKELMDSINELVSCSHLEDNGADAINKSPDWTDSMIKMNKYLKELNDILAEQTQLTESSA